MVVEAFSIISPKKTRELGVRKTTENDCIMTAQDSNGVVSRLQPFRPTRRLEYGDNIPSRLHSMLIA